jgi:hypothetical protein
VALSLIIVLTTGFARLSDRLMSVQQPAGAAPPAVCHANINSGGAGGAMSLSSGGAGGAAKIAC